MKLEYFDYETWKEELLWKEYEADMSLTDDIAEMHATEASFYKLDVEEIDIFEELADETLVPYDPIVGDDEEIPF